MNPSQSVLAPHGPHADAVASLAWLLFVGGVIIFCIVMALAAIAMAGRGRGWLADRRAIVAGGIVFPVVVLSALLVHALLVGARLAPRAEADILPIEVTAEQWWWRVRYLDPAGATDFVTANEITLPVGRMVELRLGAKDVIHSFWVPGLAGKLDMIPGQVNRLQVQIDRAAVLRGQCAEFCGGPHGQMALIVVGMAAPEFDAWRDKQRRPRPAGASHGRVLFLEHCATCHTVRGTPAAGVLGPDLTHLGARHSIAAGILPNNAGTIAAWIAAAQRIKPGNLMPAFAHFEGDDLRALAGWLAQEE